MLKETPRKRSQIVLSFQAHVLHTLQVVSRDIRRVLTQRANAFNIVLDDVSITQLTFGREYTHAIEAKQVAQQEAERAKFIVGCPPNFFLLYLVEDNNLTLVCYRHVHDHTSGMPCLALMTESCLVSPAACLRDIAAEGFDHHACMYR